MVDPTLNRTTQRLSQVLLEQLKERLLSGQYAAGSRISIEEIKSEFGVSKQPVMDAMRRLEAIGLVHIVPQSGCRVASYSNQEVLDFFTLFSRFEGEIAAAAATRRTDEQLVRLDAIWQTIADLEVSHDVATKSHGYRRYNREFHLVIHHMAHSRIMAELSERMWDMSDFFINTIGGAQHLADALADRNHDHDIIRNAIRSRSTEIARVAMQTHILETVGLFSDSPARDV